NLYVIGGIGGEGVEVERQEPAGSVRGGRPGDHDAGAIVDRQRGRGKAGPPGLQNNVRAGAGEGSWGLEAVEAGSARRADRAVAHQGGGRGGARGRTEVL